MDLLGAPKLCYRVRLMHLLMRCIGMKFMPRTECLFSLGAQYAREGQLLEGSELDTFTNMSFPGVDLPFIYGEQYVSVEGRSRAIYEQNIGLKDMPKGWRPTCIWGDFTKALKEFSADSTTPAISLLNADYMVGIETALPDIKGIFEALEHARLPVDSKGTLIAINVVADQRWRRSAMGKTFGLPLPTLRAQAWFRALEVGSKKRDRLVLVDDYTYDNKPVGNGAHSTKMQTLVFWWGLKRDLSGIRGWVREKVGAVKRRKCSYCHLPGHYIQRCPKVPLICEE